MCKGEWQSRPEARGLAPLREVPRRFSSTCGVAVTVATTTICYESRQCRTAWSRSVVRRVGLLVIIIAGSLFGTCAANSASNIFGASFSQQAGQVWSFQTPFGIIYGTIPREVVDYPTAHSTGTIVVSTSQRRLYYVLGGGKAIRYGIAVGMEGYAWSGVSTVAAKREWPDWTPTPDELRRMPYLPHHMVGGPDNPLGARALSGRHALSHPRHQRALEARRRRVFRLYSHVQ